MTDESHELLRAGIAADVRDGTAADAVDDCVPRRIVTPHDAASVAGVLAHAAERRLRVLLRGGGTKLAWGRPPEAIDLMLDLRRLDRILAHAHGDLTVRVEAGVTIGTLNAALAPFRQWLPLDGLGAGGATIGGLLATNDSGSLRHRYGAPRDLVIGVELATADGARAKAGGQVVKNVAGYDLSKIVSGSFGSLAAVLAATFKLSPVPETTGTVVSATGTPEALAEVVARIHDAHLEPLRFDVRVAYGSAADARCLVQFASVRPAVDAQVARAREIAAPAAVQTLAAEDERQAWHEHLAVEQRPGALVRLSWPPANLPEVLRLVADLAAARDVELIGRAAVGAGLLRLHGDHEWVAQTVRRLRASPLVGHVVVGRAPRALKEIVDVWPPLPNGRLFTALKRELDPAGILGAGRYPGEP